MEKAIISTRIRSRGAIATALKAEKLIFLTDTDGIRTKEDDPESLLYVASKTDILNMIEEGKITGGMLPKVPKLPFRH